MIQLRSRFSSRIIKKGDYFTIYVDIKNGYEKTINLKEVKISQPMGFNPVTIREQEEEQDTIIDKIWKRYNKSILGSWFNRYGMRETTPKDSSQRAGTTNHNKASESLQMPFLIRPTTEIIEGASIIHDKDEPIQPNGSYSEIFYLKAGWSGGLRPRPDTYTISCDVKYILESEIYHDRIDIDVSIYPSLGSMLVGTLVGSILGTVVKELIPRTTSVFIMSDFLPILFSNLILAFIIAVVLMRKKDVQPFLTIEDFWGGILVGFLTSYTSTQILEQLSNIQIINV